MDCEQVGGYTREGCYSISDLVLCLFALATAGSSGGQHGCFGLGFELHLLCSKPQVARHRSPQPSRAGQQHRSRLRYFLLVTPALSSLVLQCLSSHAPRDLRTAFLWHQAIRRELPFPSPCVYDF